MDDGQKELEHLKLIQAVIERMAQNSFFIKGWAVTLISALYAFASRETNQAYVLIGVLPFVLFWYLDAYFLSQERLYRKFYDHARKGDHQDNGDFDLTPHQTYPPEPVFQTMFRNTIWSFYLTVAATTFVVWLISQRGVATNHG